MTSRQRIVAAVARQPVDYVPCCITFNPLTGIQRQGHQWQFPWPPGAPADELLRYQVEELGLDQVVHFHVAASRPAADARAEIHLEGDVLHKTWHTPAGELHAAIRYNELWPHGEDIPFYSDFNIGHYVEPWLQTEADLEALRALQQPVPEAELRASAGRRAAQARARADRFGLATIAHVGTGMTGAQHLFGAKELCLLTIENPELVDAYLEHEHRLNLRALAALEGTHTDLVRRNGFYETADFYSPMMLERFLGGRLRAEIAAAHAAGALMTYTVHTGVMPILDYLAALEMDSLFGIDLAFPGVDPVRVRDVLAGVSSFWTGPSSTYHLWKGPEPTRAAVRRTFEVFGRTGLILSPCVSAHSIMPWESTLAMIDEWRELRA